mgnify:CR=1 FL=1
MGRVKSILKSWVRCCLYRFPIQKDKIVFINYDGKGYGDNPKYIAEELLQQNLSCKLVWLIKEDCYVPGQIKKVYYYSLSAYKELSTASVIISNCKNNIPYYYKKKENQYYLQTWHGDFALKYIEKEVEDILSKGYVQASKADSSVTDAVLSGNKQFSQILKDSFWLPKQCEILEFGVPRNDVYFKGDEIKNIIKQKYGFSGEDKILLYAPTFRDYDVTSCYNIDFERLRNLLCQLSNENWKVVIRLHPNISSKSGMFCYDKNIQNGSDFADQQELCLISDCLITDYSSIMGDFLLMRKPVFLYAPDLEQYSDKTKGRGLREMYFQLPFSMSRNQIELEWNISQFDKVEYSARLDAFMQDYYCSFDDGHASERVVNHLKEVIGFA